MKNQIVNPKIAEYLKNPDKNLLKGMSDEDLQIIINSKIKVA